MYCPIPGQPNTCSTTNTPENISPTCKPVIDSAEPTELRSTWRARMLPSVSPFARAVRA
jgi:hypothetical protein